MRIKMTAEGELISNLKWMKSQLLLESEKDS